MSELKELENALSRTRRELEAAAEWCRLAIIAAEDRVGAAAVETVRVMEGKPVAGEWHPNERGTQMERNVNGALVAAANERGFEVFRVDSDDHAKDVHWPASVEFNMAAADAWARANPHLLDWQMPPASEPAPRETPRCHKCGNGSDLRADDDGMVCFDEDACLNRWTMGSKHETPAAPTGTARDPFDAPAATWQAAIDRHMLHANKCTKCTSEHLCPTGAPLWARYVELFNARDVAAPPPPPAEPRAGEAQRLAALVTKWRKEATRIERDVIERDPSAGIPKRVGLLRAVADEVSAVLANPTSTVGAPCPDCRDDCQPWCGPGVACGNKRPRPAVTPAPAPQMPPEAVPSRYFIGWDLVEPIEEHGGTGPRIVGWVAIDRNSSPERALSRAGEWVTDAIEDGEYHEDVIWTDAASAACAVVESRKRVPGTVPEHYGPIVCETGIAAPAPQPVTPRDGCGHPAGEHDAHGCLWGCSPRQCAESFAVPERTTVGDVVTNGGFNAAGLAAAVSAAEGAPQPVDPEFPLSLIRDARESAEKMERAEGGCLACHNAITHTDDGHEGHEDGCDVANILDRLDDLEAHLNNSAAPATEGGK